MVRLVLVLVAILASTGCSLRNVNRATLAASTVSLACDWGQTRSAAMAGWDGYHEENRMLGARPTTSQVDTYFVVAAIANTFVWLVMPKKLRSIVPVGVFAAQAHTIEGNRDTTPGVCGIGAASGRSTS